MSNLPIEKQITHEIFCRQLESLDLVTAKALLIELHLLYLSQQAVFTQIAKQQFSGGIQ
jgi:hypothetical protein